MFDTSLTITHMRLCVNILFALFLVAVFPAVSDAAAAEPKEPKPPRVSVSEPDEPLPNVRMDDLPLKAPEEPVAPDRSDRDIFKSYEKEPDIPIFEPDIRLSPKTSREPDPFAISPDGELNFICPKGLICR